MHLVLRSIFEEMGDSTKVAKAMPLVMDCKAKRTILGRLTAHVFSKSQVFVICKFSTVYLFIGFYEELVNNLKRECLNKQERWKLRFVQLVVG